MFALLPWLGTEHTVSVVSWVLLRAPCLPQHIETHVLFLVSALILRRRKKNLVSGQPAKQPLSVLRCSAPLPFHLTLLPITWYSVFLTIRNIFIWFWFYFKAVIKSGLQVPITQFFIHKPSAGTQVQGCLPGIDSQDRESKDATNMKSSLFLAWEGTTQRQPSVSLLD